MVVSRHQCLLPRRDVVQVYNYEVKTAAELRIQLYQPLGLTGCVPAVGRSKKDYGRLAGRY